jgi:23S rRNA (guanine745-N1)-methyltransferase
MNATEHDDSTADRCTLTCPICTEPLRRDDGALRCPAGHSFDIAREGYVNLLPPQHRTRGLEGDLPEMLRARRRFLEAGYYSPLRELLAEAVAEFLDDDGRADSHRAGGPPCIAEVGCGEGYYIGGIGTLLRERYGLTPRLFGMDLARAAVRLAARRYPEVTSFVGDVNRRIYLASGSLQVLLDIFAPRNPAEFARVLAPGGRAIVVIPAPEHLASIREAFGLLEIQEEKEQRVLERFATDFDLVDRAELRYPFHLQPSAVADLIAMGPSQWHLEPGRELPEGPAEFATEAAFVVLTLERGNPPPPP